MSPGQGHLPLGLPGRHCCLALRQGHTSGADAAGDVLPPGDGLQTEPSQVSPVPSHDSSLVRSPMIAPVGSLASAIGRTVPYSSNVPGIACVSQSHPPPSGADGRSPQFCMPGAQVPLPLHPAFYQEQHSGSGSGSGQTHPSPSLHAGRVGALGAFRSLETCSPLPCLPSQALSVDGCVSDLLRGSTRACSGGLGEVVVPGRAVLRAIVFFDLCDLSLRIFTDNETVRYALASCRGRSLQSPPGAAGLPVRGGLPEPQVPSAAGPHSPECSGRHPQSRGTTQHRVDPFSSGFQRCPALGLSSGGGPDGVSDQPPPSQLGVVLPLPGRSGSGLSKYQLERLQVFLSVSSSDHDTPAPTPHPLVQVAESSRSSFEAHDLWFPPLLQQANDHLLMLSTPYQQTGAGIVLHSSGPSARWTTLLYLRQVLGARYPARVVSTLLVAFRPSSQRQHDLAWRTFQSFLPVHTCDISHSLVVEFLQHLFDDLDLSPRTVLCYLAALKWPLREAFQVDFEHVDFRCQATGLFHLRPPPSSPLPQWDLTAVLHFYESVDAFTTPIHMLFLQALFLTALATGNRCAEMAHFSRWALVDSRMTLTLGVMTRFFYKNSPQVVLCLPLRFPSSVKTPPYVWFWPSALTLPKLPLPHNDYVFLHPVPASSLVAGRLNYWVVQAISAANIRGSVICAHDVRKFAFSVNWARRADLHHILSYGFYFSVLKPLPDLLPVCPPRLGCSWISCFRFFGCIGGCTLCQCVSVFTVQCHTFLCSGIENSRNVEICHSVQEPDIFAPSAINRVQCIPWLGQCIPWTVPPFLVLYACIFYTLCKYFLPCVLLCIKMFVLQCSVFCSDYICTLVMILPCVLHYHIRFSSSVPSGRYYRHTLCTIYVVPYPAVSFLLSLLLRLSFLVWLQAYSLR